MADADEGGLAIGGVAHGAAKAAAGELGHAGIALLRGANLRRAGPVGKRADMTKWLPPLAARS